MRLSGDSAELGNETVQLQLTRVAFKRTHFNYTCFFEEIEAKHIIVDLVGVLDLPCQ